MTLHTAMPIVLAMTLVLLSACSSRDDDTSGNDVEQNDTLLLSNADTTSYAYAFTRASNYSSGQIERINITAGNVIDGTYPSTKSDHRLATNGEDLYQIGRFKIDNLTKFDAVDTSVVEYQLSVKVGDAETYNPQSLAFVDDNLAYLTRRGSDTILILDPTPEELTSESLITGQVSLADYNLGSGASLDVPDMTDAVIVNNKLFVLLELHENNAPITEGYIAVIDLTTNLEIPTDAGQFPLKGIQLQTTNPTSLQYNDNTGLLYVAGQGNYFGNEAVSGDPYTGGIESIDPNTFATNFLVDDGTKSSNLGFFSKAVIVSNTLGYVITLDGYDGFNSINNLRTFNPSTGVVSDPIAGTAGQSLTTLALAPNNELWVGIQDNTPGFMRIDLNTGAPVGERIATTLIPDDVVFIEVDNQ